MWCEQRRNLCDDKLAAEIKSYKEAVASIDASLKKLGLDYIDLMIIHSPKPWAKFLKDEPYFEGNREAWRALEEDYTGGKLRSIGVSTLKKQTWITSLIPVR